MSIDITTRGIAIHIKSTSRREFVEIDIYGRLEHRDYQVMIPVMHRAVEAVKDRELDVLVDMREFEGWTFEAAIDDMKFGFEFKDSFDKLAIVGDRKWEEIATDLMKHITGREIEYFENYDEALSWLLETP
jgi:hypothetical protein